MIEITNIKNGAEINIFGDIGGDMNGWTLEKFSNELSNIPSGKITVKINSRGGSIIEALAIRDAIRAMPHEITTEILGVAASAATIISTAGDIRRIAKNAKMLVHNSRTATEGTKEDHEKTIEGLDNFDKQLIDIYHEVTGKRKTRLASLMKEERLLSAQEALDWGFVNEIIPEKIINKTQVTMSEDLMKLLKVENETDLLKAVNKVIEDSEAKDVTIAELENKVKDFEVAEKQVKAEAINEFLNNAVKEGRIEEAAKEKWFALAENDFDTVKASINSIKMVQPGGIENFIEAGDPDSKLTAVERWEKNLKAGVYKNDINKAKADYKAAFGKELTI